MRELATLTRSSPVLNAWTLQIYVGYESAIADLVAPRIPRPRGADDPRPRLIGALAMASVRIALDDWLRHGGSLPQRVRTALAAIGDRVTFRLAHACSHRPSPRRPVPDPAGARVDPASRSTRGSRQSQEGTEPWVQTPEMIEKMRVAGRIAAGALAEAGKAVAPGVTTDELDRIAHEYMLDHGAYPSTLGYKGFPKSCCTSLNEVICHGIPDSTVIQDGDIVNIDVTAYIDGVHGDTNATFLAGDVSEEHRLLVERTHEATMRAIKAVKPGRALSVVGRVIESYANRFGYHVVRDFTGHGIGTTFHNGLVVLHYDQPAVDTVIEPGMTFTIEPMINLGSLDYEIWDDGWTVATKDKKWTAQFEHTLVVTDDGAEILVTRISAPVSVTTRVCSNWAVHDLSLVVTVQSSSQMSQSIPPRVIIGSMVKVMPCSITVLTAGSS